MLKHGQLDDLWGLVWALAFSLVAWMAMRKIAAICWILRRAHWLRFGLRGLLTFMAAVGVTLAVVRACAADPLRDKIMVFVVVLTFTWPLLYCAMADDGASRRRDEAEEDEPGKRHELNIWLPPIEATSTEQTSRRRPSLRRWWWTRQFLCSRRRRQLGQNRRGW